MSINQNKIAILGCGWLGLPLAQKLIADGYTINGSTTDENKLDEIQSVGAKPFIINVNPKINADYDFSFFDADILIVNIPPQRRTDIVLYHTQQFTELCHLISKSNIRYVLMISSTSVYPARSKTMIETDATAPDKDSGKALVIAEKLISFFPKVKTTIVRFGGLIGYDRNPGRFLAGKSDLKDGNSPVNIIHRDDCLEIISEIIKQDKWGEMYNACCDEHPTRKEFYSYAARKFGFTEPLFTEQEKQNTYKIIDSSKLKNELGYSFIYKNPLDSI